MREVILLSGGVESTTLLYQQHAKNEVLPLFIDYGQRAAKQELASAILFTDSLNLKLTLFDVAKAGEALRAHQEHKMHVPIPHRNLVILSLGFSFAAQVDAQQLNVGLNLEDTQTYASATKVFIKNFQSMVATLENIIIATSFIDMTKENIVILGKNLCIDYSKTYSCLLGYSRHCGACPQCLKRRLAMQGADVVEPANFYRRP